MPCVSVTELLGGATRWELWSACCPARPLLNVLALFCESREDGATQRQGVRREPKAGSQAPETWGWPSRCPGSHCPDRGQVQVSVASLGFICLSRAAGVCAVVAWCGGPVVMKTQRGLGPQGVP